MQTMEGRRWRIGELAGATGVSVRALRHYDEVGLLEPTERSSAGYRLYADAEVQRLYRILALRGLGMSLKQIRAVLAALTLPATRGDRDRGEQTEEIHQPVDADLKRPEVDAIRRRARD